MGMDLKTKQLLDLPASETDVDWTDLLDWARDEEGGQLPRASARHFADWLNAAWNDWTEDEEATVKDVLEGAVTEWCGGRTF